MLPRIVVFDLVGTLTKPQRKPETQEKLEFIKTLQREGVRAGPQELEAVVNYSLFINCPRKRFTSLRELLFDIIRLLGESASEQILQILSKMLRNAIPGLRSSTKGILDELRIFGIMSTVATDFPMFLTTRMRDDLTGYIEKWYSPTDFGFPRGHPEFLPRIFEDLKTQPEHTLVVGDDELLDFHLPKAAGAQVLYIGETDLTPSVQTIEEIPKFIRELI